MESKKRPGFPHLVTHSAWYAVHSNSADELIVGTVVKDKLIKRDRTLPLHPGVQFPQPGTQSKGLVDNIIGAESPVKSKCSSLHFAFLDKIYLCFYNLATSSCTTSPRELHPG